MLWGIVVVSILPHFHPCPLVVLVVVLLLPCHNRPCIRHLVPAYSIIVDCCVVPLINQPLLRHHRHHRHRSRPSLVVTLFRRIVEAIRNGEEWRQRCLGGADRMSASRLDDTSR